MCNVLIDITSIPIMLSVKAEDVVKRIEDKYETLSDTENPKHFSLSIYDGINRQYDKMDVDIYDILLSVAFNSQVDTAIKIESVYKNIDKLKDICKKLASTGNVDFHSISMNDQSPLVTVFVNSGYSESKDKIPHLLESSLSKILHKKFPKLVPILDSKFVRFYKERYEIEGHKRYWRPSEKDRTQYYTDYYLKLFRAIQNDVVKNIDTLILASQQIVECSKNRKNGPLVLSPLRIWDLIVWDYVKKVEDETKM